MAVDILTLTAAIDEFLAIDNFKDYCPNGLQVEASSQIKKIVTGVTASQALIDAAIAKDADVLLVHHGYFWQGESQPLTSFKGKRIASLFRNNLSLLAYHLPLDAHPEVGNNQQLAEIMGWQVTGSMEGASWPLGLVGELKQPLSAAELSQEFTAKLGQEPLVLAGHQRPLQRLAWCTGSADKGIIRAAELGVDAYISGEVSEQTQHLAQELGVTYFAAGHHATERYGVQALGRWVAQKFNLEVEFIEIANPV